MKKRRTLIISLLLIAALALGIGYAGFTSQLSIGGEAILNGVSESEVVITKIEIAESSGNHITANANCGTNGTKAATVDVSGFKDVNESAVLTVTVSNPHPFAVTTTAPALVIDEATNKVGSTEAKYFDIKLVDGQTLPATIAAGDTATFQINVTAKTIDPNAHTTNFTVTFNASSRDNT